MLQATVHLVSSDQDEYSVFKLHTLKFSTRDSKHNFFNKTFKPLATRLIKKQIKKASKGSITTGMEYFDGQLIDLRDRMVSVKATEGKGHTKVLQDVCYTLFFCSCLNRFADVVHLFYIDVQENGRDFHSLPTVASGTHSSRSCITNGTQSWTLGFLLGGSIAQRSTRMLPSMARIGSLKCTCFSCCHLLFLIGLSFFSFRCSFRIV